MSEKKYLIRNITSMLYLCLALAVCQPVFGQAAVKTKNAVATDVTAAAMRYNDAAQTVVFEGGVHITRPDFQLWADKITLYFAKKSDNTGNNPKGETDAANAQPLGMRMQAGNIERIVAENSVRIVKEDKVGTCDRGVYSVKDGVLTMEGNPVIQDGKKNSIRGQVIKFHINENRSEVLGGVHATFSSQPGDANVFQDNKAKPDPQ